MPLILSELHVPELAGMPLSDRERLINSAKKRLSPLIRFSVFIFCSSGALAGSLLLQSAVIAAGWALKDISVAIFCSLAGIGMDGFAGGFIGKQIFIARLRHHIRDLGNGSLSLGRSA